MSEQTIAAEKLAVLTGITDRRVRQIAKEGYFPPPIRGQYQLTSTLQGLFRYYRELGERQRNKRDQIDEEKHRKLKLGNDEAAGLLTNTQQLADKVAPSMTAFRDLIYSKLEQEAPVSMAGLDVPSARIIGRRMAGELLTKLGNIFGLWKL